ncbi:hypothetical protein [Pseudorhodoplanes sp.]|uniref:hypothetical protein n=1 Tax=Pseudorhodoplanes sp. TaxID=1934341 RepID=UPI002BCB6ECD|nr:hypothetical protein [Pseudorhodoplanes sp.]HWV53940.1 hypothetical protein [Pseudorhodoplanes sp.]
MASESQWWQRFGNWAQIASACIAMIGFGAIVVQVGEIRQNNRASAARQVYLAYADLNFRYPQFGAPDYDRLKAGDRLVFEQYKSFVSYLLYACGEVIYAFAKEPEWIKSCEYEVKDQLPFLCETLASDPQFLQTFGRETNAFVRAAMTREGVLPPDCRPKKA